MRKMLIAESSEVNRSLLYDIFASQYELLQTDSSETVFRLLMEEKDSIAILLINESIAARISDETVKTLSVMNVFEKVPVIVILNGDASRVIQPNFHLPFSEVVDSPVNPYIIKKRVANLVNLFSNKYELETLISDQTKKILEQNQELRQQQKKINTINNDMLDTLSMVIEYRDVESGRHIHRIRRFTEVLLRVLADKYPKYGLTEDKIELITSASSIHDIGKIAIPDSILLSPNRLSFDEFLIMKQHTLKGCEILDQLESVEKNEYFRYCYDICHYHHEKWDGQGYPDGLVGDQIPIWAQVVSLADCYDALTSERPYKSAYSHEQAVEMIRSGACGTFSDEMMDCFSAVLPKFRELAIEYADTAHEDSSISDQTARTVQNMPDHTKRLYLKMDRKDLIGMIENQKLMLEEGRKNDQKILFQMADFVFEFDIKNDVFHERKGSMKDICGFIPKNYEETINVLSENCAEDEKNLFLRTFRMSEIRNMLELHRESAVLESAMNLNSDAFSVYYCAAIPVLYENELSRIFFVMLRLPRITLGSSEVADRDAVTGLWNYSGVEKEVDDFLSNGGKSGYHALMLIDIDNFREINQHASYLFGNDILREIAGKLRHEMTNGNILGRMDDDNFLVFLNDCPDAEERNLLIEDIFKSLQMTFSLEDETLPDLSSSVGIALYPKDGENFRELYQNASRAVEIAKLNGKNMYLYYHKNMRQSWEPKKYETTLGTLPETGLEPVELEEYFLPLIDSGTGRIISYDMIEVSGNYMVTIDNIFECLSSENQLTALSINNVSRLIASVYKMEQEKLSVPALSIYTMFDAQYAGTVLTALEEILKNTPIKTRHLCLMLTQQMVADMNIHELTDFVSNLKNLGFRVGVYHVGKDHIPVNCLIDRLFHTIVFTRSFWQAVADGIYHIDFLANLLNAFDRSGTRCVLPGGVTEDLISQLRMKTGCSFGIHKGELLSLNELKLQLSRQPSTASYPALGQGSTALVLNEKMYDEILEQTRSFIIEWSPRFDHIKISGSFEAMYGYVPETDDFVRNLRQHKLIHPDDIKKLLEKMNNARSEENESEAFIRVYHQPGDLYIWNRVRFVTLKNAAQVPIKIILVFTDISDERDGAPDEKRKDRTDFITNLYNKHATENKIKSFLYDEGSASRHALMIVEICHFDTLENSLGPVFANAVLKETAQNIRELFRDSDIIGRSSGNRFTVFIKGMSDKEKILEKASQISRIINNHYQSETGDITIYGKIGVSLFPNNGSTYDDLYSGALRALYFAKHQVNSHIAFASEADHSTKLLHD